MESNEQPTIRVMVVDDQQIVRRGLALVVDGFSDMQLVAEASSGDEAIQTSLTANPDVILMDLKMPNTDGMTAARAILDANSQISIIALTSFVGGDLVQEALRAGMIGYMLKDASADELAQAIRDAYAAKPTLAWEATQALIDSARSAENVIVDLTDREVDVLGLIANGLTNRQIAIELDISPNTVNAHVRSILSKLGASSRAEAVSIASRRGLIA